MHPFTFFVQKNKDGVLYTVLYFHYTTLYCEHSIPLADLTMPGSFIFTMRLMHSAYANHKRKVMVIYDISFWMGGRYDCIQLYILYTAQMKLKTKHIHNFSTQTSNDPLEIVRQMAWIYP